jgi:hypothetical protein
VAIASVGTVGTAASFASTTTLQITTATNALAAGDEMFCGVGFDNLQTTDGASNSVTDVSGGTGTWEKQDEETNGNGAAAAGISVALWKFKATGTVAIGTVITITFSAAIVEKCAWLWKYTVGAGKKLQLTSGATNPTSGVNDAATSFPSLTFAGLPSLSRLYLEACARAANTATTLTVSTNFTQITGLRTHNAAAAVMARGEFRINTSTGETSVPSILTAGDNAATFAAYDEVDITAATAPLSRRDRKRRRRVFLRLSGWPGAQP